MSPLTQSTVPPIIPVIETKRDVVRLSPIAARVKQRFGEDGAPP